MVHDGDVGIRIGVAIALASGTMNLHHIAQHFRVGFPFDQGAETSAALGRDRIVRVHPEQPLPPGVPQRLVPGSRKVVAPGEVEQPPAIRLDDPGRVVHRARIDDDHLIDPGPDALEAGRERLRRVTDNHAQREPDLFATQKQSPVRGQVECEGTHSVRATVQSLRGNSRQTCLDRLLPLVPKALLVLAQEPREIHSAANERPTAEMVNKRVARDHCPIPRPDRPQAVVVVLEAADAEPLVEHSDRCRSLPSGSGDRTRPVDLYRRARPSFALPHSHANPSRAARSS